MLSSYLIVTYPVPSSREGASVPHGAAFISSFINGHNYNVCINTAATIEGMLVRATLPADVVSVLLLERRELPMIFA